MQFERLIISVGETERKLMHFSKKGDKNFKLCQLQREQEREK